MNIGSRRYKNGYSCNNNNVVDEGEEVDSDFVTSEKGISVATRANLY